MKNIFLYIVLIFLLNNSCKKNELKPIDWTKYYFSLNEITQRDSVSNLIGTVKSNDWTLMPISQATTLELKAIYSTLYADNGTGEFMPGFRDDTVTQNKFDLKRYNQNCTDTFTFKMQAYPNPLIYVYPTQPYIIPFTPLHIDYQTNLNVKVSIFSLFDRFGNSLSEQYIVTGSFLLNWLASPPSYQRDYILYYIIYTQEGCVFFGHGNVIGAPIKE